MPSRLPNSPRWAVPTLMTTPMSGGVMPHSQATCPRPRAPISATRKRVAASTWQAVSGAPISLLNEPIGATVGLGGLEHLGDQVFRAGLARTARHPDHDETPRLARRPRRTAPGSTGRRPCRPRRPAAGWRPPGSTSAVPAPAAATCATKSCLVDPLAGDRDEQGARGHVPGVRTTSGSTGPAAGPPAGRPPAHSASRRSSMRSISASSPSPARPVRRRTGSPSPMV